VSLRAINKTASSKTSKHKALFVLMTKKAYFCTSGFTIVSIVVNAITILNFIEVLTVSEIDIVS
jgi:hypothetical protein